MDDQTNAGPGSPTGSSTSPGSPAGTGTATDEGPRLGADQVRDLGHLSRTTADRYLAGVAGGLGRHFGVDPTVVRVLLAVLALFGGAGLLVYAAVWAFVPEDGRDRAPLEVGPEGRRAVVLVAGLLAVLVLLGTPFAGDGWGWGAGWGVGFGIPLPLLLLVLVVAALVSSSRQRRERQDAPPPAPWGAAEPGPVGATRAATPPPPRGGPARAPAPLPPPPAPRPRRTGLLLFWPTVALVAIALGVLGILDVDGDVLVSAYAALALGIVALMLLVGAFVGRPGGLVALGLVGCLALGVTSIVDAAGGSSVRADETYVVPVDAEALQGSYTDGNGLFTLDLADLPPAALDGRDVAIRIGTGEARVVVPDGVLVRVDAEVDLAGGIEVDGRVREGINPTFRGQVGDSGPGTPVLDLEVDARAGQITVSR